MVLSATVPPVSQEPLPGWVQGVRARFAPQLTALTQRTGIFARIELKPEGLLPICQYLRDAEGFGHCASIGGIDWREEREVVYHLWSDQKKGYLELSLRVPAPDAHVESVTPLWPGANYLERETWDLVGIRFDHHPDLRRLFMPEGYEFHPLLKTFELHEPELLEVKTRHE
jgi:NADH-quinone oxidoreductase subunit C